jgi:hypothetical protein
MFREETPAMFLKNRFDFAFRMNDSTPLIDWYLLIANYAGQGCAAKIDAMWIAPTTGGELARANLLLFLEYGYEEPNLLGWFAQGPSYGPLNPYEDRYAKALVSLVKTVRSLRHVCPDWNRAAEVVNHAIELARVCGDAL